MASTYWKPFQGSLTPGVVCLNATWTIDPADGSIATYSGDLIPGAPGGIGPGVQIFLFNAAGEGSVNYYNKILACDITMTNDAGFAAAESMAYNVFYDIVHGPAPLGTDQNGFVVRWTSLTSTITTDSTGVTTEDDNSVVVADTSALAAGMGVSGVGIVAGSFIKSVDSSTEISLSHNATITDTGVTLTFDAPEIPTNAELGSKTYHCALWVKNSSV